MHRRIQDFNGDGARTTSERSGILTDICVMQGAAEQAQTEGRPAGEQHTAGGESSYSQCSGAQDAEVPGAAA